MVGDHQAFPLFPFPLSLTHSLTLSCTQSIYGFEGCKEGKIGGNGYAPLSLWLSRPLLQADRVEASTVVVQARRAPQQEEKTSRNGIRLSPFPFPQTIIWSVPASSRFLDSIFIPPPHFSISLSPLSGLSHDSETSAWQHLARGKYPSSRVEGKMWLAVTHALDHSSLSLSPPHMMLAHDFGGMELTLSSHWSVLWEEWKNMLFLRVRRNKFPWKHLDFGSSCLSIIVDSILSSLILCVPDSRVGGGGCERYCCICFFFFDTKFRSSLSWLCTHDVWVWLEPPERRERERERLKIVYCVDWLGWGQSRSPG